MLRMVSKQAVRPARTVTRRMQTAAQLQLQRLSHQHGGAETIRPSRMVLDILAAIGLPATSVAPTTLPPIRQAIDPPCSQRAPLRAACVSLKTGMALRNAGMSNTHTAHVVWAMLMATGRLETADAGLGNTISTLVSA